MVYLHYADGSVLTSDSAADAVLRYARALAGYGAADLVEVPIVHEGHEATARMLVGPASQLYTTPSDEDADVDDHAFVLELMRRSDKLDYPAPARNIDGADGGGEDWELQTPSA